MPEAAQSPVQFLVHGMDVGGAFVRLSCALHVPEISQIHIKYLFIKEYNGIKRLILSAGSDIFISCQVGNKLRNLLLPHILWMLLFVEHDKSSNPLHIRLFSSDRIMLLSNYISDLF